MNTKALSEKILNGDVLTPEEREVAARVIRLGKGMTAALDMSLQMNGILTLAAYGEGQSSEQGDTPLSFLVACATPSPDTWAAVQQALNPERGDPLDPLVGILTRMSAAHRRYRTEPDPRVHEEEIELCQQDLLELLSREDGPALDFRRLAAQGTSAGNPELTPEQNAFETFGRAWESLQAIERGLDTDGPGFSHYSAIRNMRVSADEVRDVLTSPLHASLEHHKKCLLVCEQDAQRAEVMIKNLREKVDTRAEEDVQLEQNAFNAIQYAVAQHPDGQIVPDWSSLRVSFGRGASRGYGDTPLKQLISAVCQACKRTDPYAPVLTVPEAPGQAESAEASADVTP